MLAQPSGMGMGMGTDDREKVVRLRGASYAAFPVLFDFLRVADNAPGPHGNLREQRLSTDLRDPS
jgi:hypothetical protein